MARHGIEAGDGPPLAARIEPPGRRLRNIAVLGTAAAFSLSAVGVSLRGGDNGGGMAQSIKQDVPTLQPASIEVPEQPRAVWPTAISSQTSDYLGARYDDLSLESATSIVLDTGKANLEIVFAGPGYEGLTVNPIGATKTFRLMQEIAQTLEDQRRIKKVSIGGQTIDVKVEAGYPQKHLIVFRDEQGEVDSFYDSEENIGITVVPLDTKISLFGESFPSVASSALVNAAFRDSFRLISADGTPLPTAVEKALTSGLAGMMGMLMEGKKADDDLREHFEDALGLPYVDEIYSAIPDGMMRPFSSTAKNSVS